MSLGDGFLEWSKTQGDQKIFFIRDKNGRVSCVQKRLDAALLPVFEQLRALDTPYLPRILDIDTSVEEGSTCICVTEEYIEGDPLQSILDEEGRLSRAETLKLASDVTGALLLIHELEPPVIHRDIKPMNIVRRREGGYVLIDFDAARNFDGAASRDTRYILTPGYAPPEQYGFGQSDCRSDIFALGVTLYEAYTGKQFQYGDRLGGALGTVIHRCTALAPKRRYRDAGALSRHIRRTRRYMENRGWIIPLTAVAAACAIGFLLLAGPFGLAEDAASGGIPVTPPTPAAGQQTPEADAAEFPCVCVLEMDLCDINVSEIVLTDDEPCSVQIELIPAYNRAGCRASVHAEEMRIVECRLSRNAVDEGIASITDGGLLTAYKEGFFHVSVMVEFNGNTSGRGLLPVTVTRGLS